MGHDRKDPSLINVLVNQNSGAEEQITLLTPVKAQGNIEDWLMVILKNMCATMKDLCNEMTMELTSVAENIPGLRGFVDAQCGQYALLGVQMLWTTDVQNALETCSKKGVMKECNQKCTAVLMELSSWCLQDLKTKMNRKKIETLVTIQVHQRDVMTELFAPFRARMWLHSLGKAGKYVKAMCDKHRIAYEDVGMIEASCKVVRRLHEIAQYVN